jgi:SAM-dependent MidA family methyltransferase
VSASGSLAPRGLLGGAGTTGRACSGAGGRPTGPARGGVHLPDRMPPISSEAAARSADLARHIAQQVAADGGWLPFDRFMTLALYAPGLGYYSAAAPILGAMPGSGSDFITAPELSPHFGATLARAVAEALDAAEADTVFEFGAGSGALAEQVLDALDGQRGAGVPPVQLRIVELSAALRQRQQQRLARFGARVQWLESWPEAINGVVLGNEVLDAMPVKLLHFDGAGWFERGVVLVPAAPPTAECEAPHPDATPTFDWADRPTSLRPPGADDRAWAPGTVTEIHPHAEAFIRSLAQRLVRGAAYFIDYGFPEAEYYHPQRSTGTLTCHRAHRVDDWPLFEVGLKDITAHVNFSGIALAGQDAGLEVLGYTTQAHALINAGLLDRLHGADARALAAAQKLLAEHEMGELFKCLGFARGIRLPEPLLFARGDRSHTL